MKISTFLAINVTVCPYLWLLHFHNLPNCLTTLRTSPTKNNTMHLMALTPDTRTISNIKKKIRINWLPVWTLIIFLNREAYHTSAAYRIWFHVSGRLARQLWLQTGLCYIQMDAHLYEVARLLLYQADEPAWTWHSRINRVSFSLWYYPV